MGTGECGAGEGAPGGPAGRPMGPGSTPAVHMACRWLWARRTGFLEGSSLQPPGPQGSLGFALTCCAFLIDPDPGVGGQGPQGSGRERRGGAEEERVPGRAGKAAGAARPNPVQPRLAAGERQQAVPGRKGKTVLFPLNCVQVPVETLLSSSGWRMRGGEGIYVVRWNGPLDQVVMS